MVRKLKKETVARNLINSASDLRDLNYLDKVMGELYDRVKKKRDLYQDRMDVFDELHSEYLEDKKKFIKKYAKPVYPSQKKNQEEFLEYEDVWTKMIKKREKQAKSKKKV